MLNNYQFLKESSRIRKCKEFWKVIENFDRKINNFGSVVMHEINFGAKTILNYTEDDIETIIEEVKIDINDIVDVENGITKLQEMITKIQKEIDVVDCTIEKDKDRVIRIKEMRKLIGIVNLAGVFIMSMIFNVNFFTYFITLSILNIGIPIIMDRIIKKYSGQKRLTEHEIIKTIKKNQIKKIESMIERLKEIEKQLLFVCKHRRLAKLEMLSYIPKEAPSIDIWAKQIYNETQSSKQPLTRKRKRKC